MSEKVRMTHPDLPEAELYARPNQVAVRELSGWVAEPAAPKTTPGAVRADETKG